MGYSSYKKTMFIRKKEHTMLNKHVRSHPGNGLLSAFQTLADGILGRLHLPAIQIAFHKPQLAEHELLVPTSVLGTGYFVAHPHRFQR
jgi:hypothetical protein